MKVGDKVVCIRTLDIHPSCPKPIIGHDPVRGDILTVRCIDRCTIFGNMILMFEEIINEIDQYGNQEWGYDMDAFRKIDDTPDTLELSEVVVNSDGEILEPQTA